MWVAEGREPTYNELLKRFFTLLHLNNPELAGEKRRYTIVPPQVTREGTKKTSFANFVDICRRMHRQPEHVLMFLYAELGTQGSMDGAQRLVLRGRFNQKQIENVLRKYIGKFRCMAQWLDPLNPLRLSVAHTNIQSSTSPARSVNRPTRFSARKTVCTSSPASRVDLAGPSWQSRPVSRPRSVVVPGLRKRKRSRGEGGSVYYASLHTAKVRDRGENRQDGIWRAEFRPVCVQ